MPTRILRDGLISSERVAALSDAAFRFYLSLFCVVDDYGCLEWSPKVIRGKLYPHRDPPCSTVEICGFLTECSNGDRPLIVFYEELGKQYIQIQQFGQRLQAKSKCPLPKPPFSTVTHGEKPLRATRARSESESESESRTVVGDEVEADVLAQTLAANHPKKGDLTRVEHALAEILLRSDNRPATALLIAERHGRWCHSWAHSGVQFAPKLSGWLQDGGWRQEPPERQKTAIEQAMELMEDTG